MISKARHTQGPWRVNQYSTSSINIETKKRKVARIECPSSDMDHANAALIATAPDLLEVLEEVVLQYETGILNQATIDDLVKYVIKKAKGGE